MSNAGQFVWYELMTNDVDASKAFYGEVIGWKGQEWTGPNPYYLWSAGDTQVAGMMKMPSDLQQMGIPPHWMGYVAVDDVDATTEQARELGGQVRVPGTDIPDIGRFAVIADPQGASIALLTPSRAGTPPDRSKTGFVGWHELNTTDYESAWTFYSQLFGWKHTSSMDMGDGMGAYFMFRHPDDAEDRSLGGMSNLATQMGAPPHWLYYVNVEDVEDGIRRTRDSDGQVLNGPMDVPGGKIAQCMDPQGAAFAMYQSD